MESSLHGGSTSSDFPLIPVRKKIQKTSKARFHRSFFGNFVMSFINEQTALNINTTIKLTFGQPLNINYLLKQQAKSGSASGVVSFAKMKPCRVQARLRPFFFYLVYIRILWVFIQFWSSFRSTYLYDDQLSCS